MTDSYWLFKTEPEVFSWDMLKTRGKQGEPWDGVRNFQARNNMRAMKIGDLGFFYHSGEDREIVGIMEVSALRASRPEGRHRQVAVRGRACGGGAAEAGDAGGRQGEPDA